MKRPIVVAPAEAVDVRVSEGVVCVAVHGRVDREVGDAVHAASLQWMQQTGFKCLLLDFRAAHQLENTMGILQRVNDADLHPELSAAHIAMLCRAITGDHRFLENTARRRGHDLRVFTDGELAWRWLREAQAADS